MSTAVKPARKSSVLTEAVMRQAEQAREEKKTEAVTADQKFPKIKENPFFQVVFADGKPEEKRSAIAKARTFSGTKEEVRQREKAYAEFKELFRDSPEMIESVTPEILPASYRVEPLDKSSETVSAPDLQMTRSASP